MPTFRVVCLAYFCVAMPGSTLGVLWPSIRVSYHQPVAVLGFLLVFGISASVLASAVIGRLLRRWSAGGVLAVGTGLTAAALEIEALTPSLWLFVCGMVVFGLGFGALDAAVNVHAAARFGARRINWMHAAYGAGATVGPLLATALLSTSFTWRWVYGIMGLVQGLLALAMIRGVRSAGTAPRAERPRTHRYTSVVLGSLVFIAVESGVESGAGAWGFVFLTDGRGLTDAVAGLVVSAYWGLMFLGRVVGGAVAERVGPAVVLGWAVLGVGLGCGLMLGSGGPAVVGLMLVGLAAAPVFPLFTLTAGQHLGDAGTGQAIGLLVAASEIGSAVLPAGIGLVVGAFGVGALALPLLLLSVVMIVLGGLLSHVITRTAR